MIDFRSLFLRDAALWLALVSIAVQVAAGFYPALTPELQGVIGAAVSALFGVITAVIVRGDRLPPAILGFVQAALSLALAFGLHLPAADQATVMSGIAAIVAGFVRTQVTSQIPPPPTLAVAVTERRTPIARPSLQDMLAPPRPTPRPSPAAGRIRADVAAPSSADWVTGGGASQDERLAATSADFYRKMDRAALGLIRYDQGGTFPGRPVTRTNTTGRPIEVAQPPTAPLDRTRIFDALKLI